MNMEQYKSTLSSYETMHDLDDIEIFYDVDMDDELAPESINIYIIEHMGDDIIDEFTASEIEEFKQEIFDSWDRVELLYVG